MIALPNSSKLDSRSRLAMCPQAAEFETTRTERLADLLMLLSHEPMFAWKLNGAIEYWSAGVLELSSSTGLLQTRQSGPAATPYCKPNSQSKSPSCIHSFGTNAVGRANCVIPARRAGKSL
jgi:hypothetical protein